MRAKTYTGFTIVELIVVIVVIAILFTIAIVGYGWMRNDAIDSRTEADVSQIIKQFKLKQTKTEKLMPLSNPSNNDDLIREYRLEDFKDRMILCKDEEPAISDSRCAGLLQDTEWLGSYNREPYNVYPRDKYVVHISPLLRTKPAPCRKPDPGEADTCPKRNITQVKIVRWNYAKNRHQMTTLSDDPRDESTVWLWREGDQPPTPPSLSDMPS